MKICNILLRHSWFLIDKWLDYFKEDIVIGMHESLPSMGGLSVFILYTTKAGSAILFFNVVYLCKNKN